MFCLRLLSSKLSNFNFHFLNDVPSAVGSLVESLKLTGKFPGEKGEGGEEATEKEPEETLAWTLFLRSQLEERTGFLQAALDSLDVREEDELLFTYIYIYTYII